MPAPPILDVFVVWHPDDQVGEQAFERIHQHFHSEGYSGLAGGAVEVYARSIGWSAVGSSPRPMLLPGSETGVQQPARLSAIVPILGVGLRDAVQEDPKWADYIRFIADSVSDTIAVLPVAVPGVNLADSVIQSTIGVIQTIPSTALATAGLLERSVAQAIAQKAARTPAPIRVFISHTKHFSGTETEFPGGAVFEQVRSVIEDTHLGKFFDAHDLLPGTNWAAELEKSASTAAMLMVRTDRYASREWTQREVLAAKQHEVPIVGLIALSEGEARGSFLMDNVPTVPLLRDDVSASITASLNRLVDETLKRALWRTQSTYIRDEGFDWTPVHAPEPTTAIDWLSDHQTEDPEDDHLWIIHPDPPLGAAERTVIDNLCKLAGFATRIDILTPRTFASRGGVLDER